MSALKIAGIVLIVAGALSLSIGAFSYTKESSRLHVGALELTLKSKQTVNLPAWAGVAALVAGGALLIGPRRRGG